MINYATKIKEYRERSFLTQKELAEKLGVSTLSVIRWEKGEHEPTIKVKKKLVSFFEQAGMKTFD